MKTHLQICIFQYLVYFVRDKMTAIYIGHVCLERMHEGAVDYAVYKVVCYNYCHKMYM